MSVVFEGRFRTFYGQIGLFDVEDPDSYPHWEAGHESVVIGPKGVAVAAVPDASIQVVVCDGASALIERDLASYTRDGAIRLPSEAIYVAAVK